MNMKKTLISALLITAVNLFAADPILKLKQSNHFFETTPELFEKRSAIKASPLKLNKTALFSGSGKEWGEAEVTGSGLFLNLGLFFPGINYLNPYQFTPSYGLGFNFEIGSFFRFIKFGEGKIGLGLRASWLDFSYANFTDEKDIYRSLQIQPIHLGPQFSIAFNETMGLDAFLTIGYNVTTEFGSIDDPNEKKNVGESITYMGWSNEVGAAFHYKMFSLGFGYRSGNLNMVSYVYDGEEADPEYLPEFRFPVNNFRVTFGFRF